MKEIKAPEVKKENPTAKKPKKGNKAVSWILTVLLIAVFLFCGVVAVRTLVLKKPFIFGYGVFYVLTGSMEPEIHVGDVIVDKQVDSIADLKEGDIITYRGKEGEFKGKTVTHKIMRIEGDTIVTKGVSTMSIKEDPAITFDDVIGKYVKTSAFLTFIYKVFTNKIGFFVIIFIPLVILLIVQIVNFAKACRMGKDGKTPAEKTEAELRDEAIKEKEEEIKRKAIEEYLASKKRIKDAEDKKKE